MLRASVASISSNNPPSGTFLEGVADAGDVEKEPSSRPKIDRAAASAVRIRSSAGTGVPVTAECHGGCIETPSHGEGVARNR